MDIARDTLFSWPWADSLETNDLHDRLASSLHSISALKDEQLEAKYIKYNLNYHSVGTPMVCGLVHSM